MADGDRSEDVTALPLSPTYPYDPDVGTYTTAQPVFAQPLEFTGWQDETMSWKETCYVFAGLIPNSTVRIIGPDVLRLLSEVTTNSFANFPIGRCKHAVITDDNGDIWTHGPVMRVAEQEVHTYTLSPWIDYLAELRGPYDVEFHDHTMTEFNFQCAGPRVLEMLEHATGTDLHGLPFMAHTEASIDGRPVRILRMGMGGTLSYEVHGETSDAKHLYRKVLEAGEPFGVRRLGWLAYACNVTENGYPQASVHFQTSSVDDPGFMAYWEKAGFGPGDWPQGQLLRGSSGGIEHRWKRFRTPFANNWDRAVTFDHDFPGRAALEKEAADPTRRTVTLVWNRDDVIDVFASLFQTEQDPYGFLEFPVDNIFRDVTGGGSLFQDDVFDKDDELVGFSSFRQYSLYSRDMFSLGCIDADRTEIGTELEILWGEHGRRQKRLRAVVSKYPHLDLTPNHAYDVGTIPRLGGVRPTP